jgi:hypothetical protein
MYVHNVLLHKISLSYLHDSSMITVKSETKSRFRGISILLFQFIKGSQYRFNTTF